MSTTHEIIMAGFGGQGVLFAGRLLAYAGMMQGKEVAWCPSYGPEMRGGTANCSTIISDESVGSPIIMEPTVVVAMNKPSYDKFHSTVKSGGVMLVDSSLISAKSDRTDITFVEVPATQMANDLGTGSLANMVLLGKLMKQTGIFTLEEVKNALKKVISARKQDLFELNIKAIEAGFSF